MLDIKEFIQNRIERCEERAERQQEKIDACTNYMQYVESDIELERLKFERQQCIGKQNEFLAIADFGKELLEEYFE